jgi:2-polyprenyl-3-methyl-5-hydroxy-6-metoxy-1,4-benzoquinol methylase
MDLVELAKQNITSRHPWETVRIKIVGKKIEQLLKKLGKLNQPITILDVGSGDAYVIDQLANRFKNANFVAVDTYYNEDIINTLKGGFINKDRIELFSTWESFAERNIPIDLVLLLDVIEHVPDDIEFMQDINKFVKNEFHFIITVPAFQSLFTQHDYFLKHYRRYNNALLKKNVRAAQWTPLDTGYFYMIALIMRSLGKLKEMVSKNKVSDKGISEWNKSNEFTHFVEGVLWFDYNISTMFRTIGIKLPGLSNYTVGKRKL